MDSGVFHWLCDKVCWQNKHDSDSDKLNCGYLIYAISICAIFPKKPWMMHRLAFDEKKTFLDLYPHTQKKALNKRTSVAWDRCWSMFMMQT